MSGAGEPALETTPSPGLGWCDAQPILSKKCGRCHGKPLDNGAPFAVTTYEDVHLSDSRGTPHYERMLSAIETELMPATFIELTPPVESLTAGERGTLLEWLGADAPLGDPEPCRDTH
jgi:hypothetical protein